MVASKILDEVEAVVMMTEESLVKMVALVADRDFGRGGNRAENWQGTTYNYREVEHTRNKCPNLHEKTSQDGQFAHMAHASEVQVPSQKCTYA